MPVFDWKHEIISVNDKDGNRVERRALPLSEMATFSEATLGLGNLREKGRKVQAVAAVFDLQGFTRFCSQTEFHLKIAGLLPPVFKWIFTTLRKEIVRGKVGEKATLYCELPFFVKFMGDGVLLLWNAEEMTELRISHVPRILHNVTQQYKKTILKSLRKEISCAPEALRCGVAQGEVRSVGDGNDFVGSCINIAARLQKLSSLSFAVWKPGFNLTKNPDFWKTMITKKVALRGIGNDELVLILRREFRHLPPTEKALFQNP
jgi:class 3 adenylate cyclase